VIGQILTIAALSGLVWLANGVRKIGAVSPGMPIGSRPGTALLLIDLQSVFWDEGPYEDAAKADAMSAILVRWRDRFLFVAEAIYKSQAETGEIKGHYLNRIHCIPFRFI
jgi:hypothetical protein